MSVTRVLVVDDSAVIRGLLVRSLSRQPGIEVVGSAPDAYAAWTRIVELKPDVLTLDLEMPGMDGLAFLRKLLRLRPMPVVVVSSQTPAGSDRAIEALEAGAVEVVAKPQSPGHFESTMERLAGIVRGAAGARVTARAPRPVTSLSSRRASRRIVAIGASTGGTHALQQVLLALPKNAPGVVIVQHMPEGFTKSFARRLDDLCAVDVKEAEDRDELAPGRVLIAPGDRHMIVRRAGAGQRVMLDEGPRISGHRPSVDVLFKSVAQAAGGDAVGVLLTGMGRDGADGLLEMKRAGASTIAQDEASCVVYGMPREAVELGAADRVVPLARVASTILEMA